VGDERFPPLLVSRNPDQKNTGKHCSYGYENHFRPKREIHQFTSGLRDYHYDPGYQLQTQSAYQPRTEPICGLAQRLIGPSPSQNAENDHEYGPDYDCNANDVDGLDARDKPTLLNSEGVTQGRFG